MRAEDAVRSAERYAALARSLGIDPDSLHPYTLDLVFMNKAEIRVKDLIGRAHDGGMDEPDEGRQCLHEIVSLCSEWLGRIERRVRADADRMSEHPRECVPPVEVSR